MYELNSGLKFDFQKELFIWYHYAIGKCLKLGGGCPRILTKI